ncbi:hypothetical protein RFI_16074 [Reticulomyxa filosa]|uniref:C2H2-type domain-containing protein n=1 Tax=Reticulomyxa filosa TaxID=46433 RepID=X6N5U4_RETFI|nr:hypothetical protein RFI_16074 [Reticulomyxa filosa]|eukprot:ETO21129.1 hypothetical protein RFI_16074 [Reticulomyxa filosa]
MFLQTREKLRHKTNKRTVQGKNARGFQRGGPRTRNSEAQMVSDFKLKPPDTDCAYSRIRVWKDESGRHFYGLFYLYCICDVRKPVQDLNKIKKHALSHDQGKFQCDICGKIFTKNHLQVSSAKGKKKINKTNKKTIITIFVIIVFVLFLLLFFFFDFFFLKVFEVSVFCKKHYFVKKVCSPMSRQKAVTNKWFLPTFHEIPLTSLICFYSWQAFTLILKILF